MNNIESLIAQSGKKLTQISKETGLAYPTLSGYNQGIRTPKRENANILAEYFGVSVAYLLGYTDDPKTENLTKTFANFESKETRELLTRFIRLSDSSQELVLQLVRKLQDLEQSSSE